MSQLKRYKRRENTTVTAVKIDLGTDGFQYQKWGGVQIARRGDWLVDNMGDVYTIDGQVFEDTYSEVSPGRYKRNSFVWAEEAKIDGRVKSTSGFTYYYAGDMIAYNSEEKTDGWAMEKERFFKLYRDDD